MNRLALSPAASALLRALIIRGGTSRDRILLRDALSVDWRSLTFTGERHELELRISGPDSPAIAQRICADIEEAEFDIAGLIVADIAVAGVPMRHPDGSTVIKVEALTITAD